MANKGLSMRKVREVLRLHHVAGLSGRAIARSLKLSPTTVKRYIGRAEEAGLSWPLPESLDDTQLERRLLPVAVSMPGETRFPMPDWSRVHRELRRKGVTLALLWQEYKEAHPAGMQYIYGRLSWCKRCRDEHLGQLQHLSGITRVGVPKWGIRAHRPLQLVGLEGRCIAQARGTPVRPVVLISPSSRNREVGLQRTAW